MRRLFATFFALTAMLAVSVSAAHAQTIGFKLGASLANQDISESSLETSGITGFAGGGFIRFGRRIGVQLELLTVTKGSQIDEEGEQLFKTTIEYVEIPLLLHVPLITGQSFAPYIIAGPHVAFEIGCEVENEVLNSKFDCDDESEFENEKTDYGLSLGGGLAFAVGPGALLIEGRYSWGLKDLNPLTTGSEVKNRGALLFAGYEIPIGRR